MLVDIQTFFLDSFINTETSNLLDTPEEDDTCSSCPKVDADDTEALCAEETETATIEGTPPSRAKRPVIKVPKIPHTMNRTCTNRVINMKLGIDELNRETRMIPARRPMMAEPNGLTKSQQQ